MANIKSKIRYGGASSGRCRLNLIWNIVTFGMMMTTLLSLSGCQFARLIGGAAQNEEYQKLLDMPAKYSDLEDRTVAVLVNVDLSTLYEFPDLATNITGGVSLRIARDVPGAKVLNGRAVLNWQYRTPQWSALPYGELVEQLNVDRIVHIELLEYRLNPPGNRFLWEGTCLGRVGIVERSSIDPDVLAESFDIAVKFPSVSAVEREGATQQAIEYGLLNQFIEKTAWLFHQHIEPKYPDKYRPELDPRNQ